MEGAASILATEARRARLLAGPFPQPRAHSGSDRLAVRPDAGADPIPSLAGVLDRLDAMARDRGAPVAVVLDELQRIIAFGPDRADWRLRDAMQGHHHLSYVCAGSEEGVIETLTGPEGAFRGAFERLYLGTLPDGFARWIEERVRDAGVSGARGMGDTVVELAGPRTEDVLKLGRQVFARAAARGRYDPSDPASAMAELVRADAGIFEKLWTARTPHQRNVLRAVARGVSELTSRATRTRYDLRTSGAVSQAVDALVADGTLVRREGAVRFDDPYFQAWVIDGMPPGL